MRGRSGAVLDAEDARRLAELVVDADEPRFEAAALRGGEPLGELERCEVSERVIDRVEPLDEVSRPGAERRERRARAERRELSAGVLEQGLALAVVSGRAPGGDEREDLARLELGPLGGECERVLLVVRQGSERERDRGADRPVAEARREARREPRRERVTLGDPARTLLEHARRAGERELVLLDERAHDRRLVQRPRRAGRGVRLEEAPLELGSRARRIDQDRYELGAGDPQTVESLEPIHDLEAVPHRGGADRQIGEGRASPRRRAAAPEPGEGRVEGLDRDEAELLRAACGGQAAHGRVRQNGVGPAPGARCEATRSRGRPCHSSCSTRTSSRRSSRSLGSISSPLLGVRPHER